MEKERRRGSEEEGEDGREGKRMERERRKGDCCGVQKSSKKTLQKHCTSRAITSSCVKVLLAKM